MNTYAVVFAAVTALSFSPHAAARNFPSHQRGLSADTAYGVSEVDSINYFNGNLSLQIPVGGTFPVGPNLSYGLNLAYNSSAWDYDIGEVCKNGGGTTFRYSLPKADVNDNAGFGWRLGMGRWLAEGAYESPDGGKHYFYDRLHPNLGDGTSFYTMDSTYLRLREAGGAACAVASPCRLIEFPDGKTQEFSNFGGLDWRLRQTRDRFGNWVRVDYPTANAWSISDIHGRSHTVRFSGGRVSEIELAAFDGTTATWTFEYQTVTIPRRGFLSKCPNDPNIPETQTVALLDRVVLPGGSFYEMDYSTEIVDSGAATSLRLPTGGKIEWDYSLYFFTSIELPEGEEAESLPWSSSAGVAERRTFLHASDTNPHGIWTYQSEEKGFGDAPDDVATTPCWAQTTITDPEGNAVVHYFSTQRAVKSWSYALPFTFCHPENGYSALGPFVSQRIFQGDPENGTLLREVQQEFESDGVFSLGHDQDKNHRLKRRRIVYHDDGQRFQETAFSDFDGLGHYRSTTTTGNFFGSAVKVATTRYNPTRGTWAIDPDTGVTSGDFEMPAAADPWVWEVFTQQTSQEGSSSARSDYCFDQRGYLKWQRLLAGASPAGFDLLTVFEEQGGGTGRVAKEKSYGGDDWMGGFDDSYDPGNTCATMNLPSIDPEYQINHAYQSGVLASSKAVEPCSDNETVLELSSRQIDVNTGLPWAIDDSAGVRTELFYDALGRMVAERPAGGAWLNYSFTLPTVGSPNATPRFTVTACPNGVASCSAASSLSWVESETDGLGRRTLESIRYPAAGGPVVESRQFTYNALGWKLTESSWGDFAKKTTWSEHDAFGRPGRMVLPGKNPETRYSYRGERADLRQDRIVTGASGAQTIVHTAELKDHFGRLIEVCEGMTDWWNGSCDTHVTGYSYDNQDRLSRVCVEPKFGCDQERLFVHDGRGFMTSEKNPEVGADGNNWTRYTYDARANLRTRRLDGDTGAFALDYRYDKAGRLIRVSNGADPLKEYFYARSNAGTDQRKGKLVRAIRHNHIGPVAPHAVLGLVDFTVSDTFEYRGLDGRVSDKWTAVGFDPGTRYFHLSQTYDALGNVATQLGPVCEGWPCKGEDPLRSIANTYTKGFLTAVAGYAPAISYQLGGSMIHKVTTNNNVIWEQLINGGDRVPRPSKISTLGVQSGQSWTTGTFDYDGVWNIHQMGTAEFKYDVRSRLVDGQVDLGTTLASQAAQYDNFGNLTQLTTGGSVLPIAVSSGTNRLVTSGTTTVQYDVAGNLQDYHSTTEHLSWNWDALGTLESLRTNDLSLLHVYDAADERILTWHCPLNACSAGDTLERWTLRGFEGEILRAYEGLDTYDLAWREDFVYRGRQPLATVRAGETLYLHPDHLGTTRQVTNAGGFQVRRHHYYPFGQEATAAGPNDVPLKFTGHERDPNEGGRSSLDYMHARYGSPIWGRFLSMDFGEATLSAPQTWNRYTYVANNPIKYVDPTGEVVDLSFLHPEQVAKLLGALNAFTGNTYGVNGQGHLVLLFIGPTGSATATRFLGELISADRIFPVVASEGKTRWNPQEEQIEINFDQYATIEHGKVDPRTFNEGSTLVHELRHAWTGEVDKIGGTRFSNSLGWTGPVVDFVNKIRADRNLPLRESYGSEQWYGGRERLRFNHVNPKKPEKFYYITMKQAGGR